MCIRDSINAEYMGGVAALAYDGLGVLLHIRESLVIPENMRTKVITWTQIALLVLYAGFPVLCNIAFDESMRDIVLLSLPLGNWFYMTLIVLFGIVMVVSYPLVAYPAVKIIEKSRVLAPCFPEQEKEIASLNQIILRGFLLLIFFAVAIIMPDMHTFMEIMGCIFFQMSSSYPIILYLFWEEANHTTWSYIWHTLILVGTTAWALGGLYFALTDLGNDLDIHVSDLHVPDLHPVS
eukprot:TRINITY_DN3837_c0_g1_i8.p1 TRINITY_DN3837_c0_g1~~TRINITY_DN3837_c0_g1_i8.p1  ORF type:complete len:236 (-),score=18.55 TRINITY_DN3837_c0_g1_i8:204-911(-)